MLVLLRAILFVCRAFSPDSLINAVENLEGKLVVRCIWRQAVVQELVVHVAVGEVVRAEVQRCLSGADGEKRSNGVTVGRESRMVVGLVE